MKNLSIYVTSQIIIFLLIALLAWLSFWYQNKKWENKNIIKTKTEASLKIVKISTATLMISLTIFLTQYRLVVVPHFLILSFQMLPIFISGSLLGPFYGVVVGFIANNLCFFLYNGSDFYFAGYVLSDVWCGFSAGVFLFLFLKYFKNKKFNFKYNLAISLILTLLIDALTINFGLNLLWIIISVYLFYGNSVVITTTFLIAKLLLVLIYTPVSFLISYSVIFAFYKTSLTVTSNLTQFNIETLK